MATTIAHVFQDLNKNPNHIENNDEFSRQEIQAAISKAVELRALHAALMQSRSPTNLRFSSSPPVSHPDSQLSAHDYPVFTPSYEEEPSPGCQQIEPENPIWSEYWDEYRLGVGGGVDDQNIVPDCKNMNACSRNGLPTELVKSELHICPAEDQRSVAGSGLSHVTVLRASPRAYLYRSGRRNSVGDFRSISSCNRCKPAIITSESDSAAKNFRSSNLVVPLTDSHSSAQSQPRNRGLNLSWLFPRLRKKNKSESSPNRTESGEISQNLGIMSIEALKKELMEANESREAALMEISEMSCSLEELKQKLEYLEGYCEELKKASRQAAQSRDLKFSEKLGNLQRMAQPTDGKGENPMPVGEEVMLEGFLQIVSEARLSVKQFCKTLVAQIEETDSTLVENLNSLLRPFKLSLNSKYTKAVLYHLEAMINQAFYQDFENCVFRKNGSPKLLDPQQDRRAQFASFVSLRNLSWNEVLRKGTKCYSDDFSRFCDQKMSCIIATLNWTRPWPEQLLQSFFVAAKCIWLLHLLAFSFDPPLGILRVEENRSYDSHFMEDIFMEKQRTHGPSRVKIMVMPGFYVHDKVLRCKVLCRYKSVA